MTSFLRHVAFGVSLLPPPLAPPLLGFVSVFWLFVSKITLLLFGCYFGVAPVIVIASLNELSCCYL